MYTIVSYYTDTRHTDLEQWFTNFLDQGLISFKA